jgi:hypothetical protein
VNGSGGGSCTHGGKAYEAHLNLILPAVKLVESVGNAPTSTCLQGRCIPCLPRPRWQVPGAGARLVEIKRARSVHALGPVPFQQRTNTSWRSTRSQPAVSRRLFRCLGAHLLRSPSIVKSGLNVPALVAAPDGHTPSVERDRSVSPNSVLRPLTSFRCRFFSTHSSDPFVTLFNHSWKNKKPCLHAVSRVWKFYGLRLPAYLRSIQCGFLTLIRPG